MKTKEILTCLIFITGVHCIEHFYEVGKEYEYQYEGRILSGIPTLAPQYSGVFMQAKLIIQVYPNSWFHLFVKDVKYKSFNEMFDGTASWKNLDLVANETKSPSHSFIEKPIKFTMRNGILSEIIVSENEPEWELNFKKALVSLIKIQEHDISSVRSNSVRREGRTKLETTWRVMEQGIDGVCENRYHFSQVPDHFVPDLIEQYQLKKKCSEDQMFEITKTRDFNSCLSRTAFNVNQHGVYKCRRGTCAPNWQRSSLTRYLTCGQSLQSSKLIYIVSEGEIQQKLIDSKDEPNFGGTLQTLKLVDERNSFSELDEIEFPRMIQDILYEYTEITNTDRSNTDDSSDDEVIENELYEETLFNNNHTKQSLFYKLKPKSIEQKIVIDLQNLLEKLQEEDLETDHYVANTLLTTSDLISLLDKDNLKDLLNIIRKDASNDEKKKAVEYLFLDTALMTGTNHAINFLIDLIHNEELPDHQVLYSLVTLPHYIQTPSADIINKIFELVKSDVISKNEILKANGDIALAEILHKACIHTRRYQNFPIHILGDFCDELTQPIHEEYLPYLVDNLKTVQDQHMKISAILSMNALAHPSLLAYLKPLILGQGSSSLQFMALLSLKPDKFADTEEIKNMLEEVLFNRDLTTEVRLAALMPYLSMNLNFSDIKRLEFISKSDKNQNFADYLKSILPTELERVKFHDIHDDIFHSFNDPGFVGDNKSYNPMVSCTRQIQKNGVHQVNYLDSLFILHPNKQIYAWAKMYETLQISLFPVGASQANDLIKQIETNSLRFGLTKLFDSAPNEVIIPSEIGLPFLLEVHSPAVANLKMNEYSPAVDIKTIQVKTGYLGTICPFTRRIMAAGVDVQTVQKMSISVTDIPVQGADSELKVVVKPHENPKTRKMFFTCAKELGLLNIVHSILDKNTLEINAEDVEKTVPITAEKNYDNQVKSFTIKFPEMSLKEASDQAYAEVLAGDSLAVGEMAGGFLAGESDHSRILKAEQKDCKRREHLKLKSTQHQTCFSSDKLLHCGSDCLQGDVEIRSVEFSCYTDIQIKQAEIRGQKIPRGRGLPITVRVQVPGNCNAL